MLSSAHLPKIGCEGYYFAVIGLLQPCQDDRGVEPTGIRQYDFVDFLAAQQLGSLDDQTTAS